MAIPEISIGRYGNGQGYIEPARDWIIFLDRNGRPRSYCGQREGGPADGAVVDESLIDLRLGLLL